MLCAVLRIDYILLYKTGLVLAFLKFIISQMCVCVCVYVYMNCGKSPEENHRVKREGWLKKTEWVFKKYQMFGKNNNYSSLVLRSCDSCLLSMEDCFCDLYRNGEK